MIIDVFGRRENPVSTVCGSALMKTPLILSAWGQQGSCMCNTCLCLNSCCTGSESHKSVFHPSTPCSVEMKEELIKNRWEDAPCNIYIYLAVGRDTEEEVKLNSNCIDYKTLSLPVNCLSKIYFFFFFLHILDRFKRNTVWGKRNSHWSEWSLENLMWKWEMTLLLFLKLCRSERMSCCLLSTSSAPHL